MSPFLSSFSFVIVLLSFQSSPSKDENYVLMCQHVKERYTIQVAEKRRFHLAKPEDSDFDAEAPNPPGAVRVAVLSLVRETCDDKGRAGCRSNCLKNQGLSARLPGLSPVKSPSLPLFPVDPPLTAEAVALCVCGHRW